MVWWVRGGSSAAFIKIRGMRSPVWLLAGFGLFVVLLGYLVVSSLTRREVPTFEVREVLSRRAAQGPDTLTVDASASGPWRFVDLDQGRVVFPPDTATWDLAIRRFHLIASDAIADAGPVPFDELAKPPADGYKGNSSGTDTTNAAIGRWYSYSMLSHLLVPKGQMYVVRTRGGRFAKLELLSYYCPGLQAGCVTFRYAFFE
jgi:hypothetical protein